MACYHTVHLIMLCSGVQLGAACGCARRRMVSGIHPDCIQCLCGPECTWAGLVVGFAEVHHAVRRRGPNGRVRGWYMPGAGCKGPGAYLGSRPLKFPMRTAAMHMRWIRPCRSRYRPRPKHGMRLFRSGCRWIAYSYALSPQCGLRWPYGQAGGRLLERF